MAGAGEEPPAQPWTSTALNYAIDFPAGWNQSRSPRPDVEVVAEAPDRSQSIMLMAGPAPPQFKLVTDDFVRDLKRSLVQRGSTIETDRVFSIGGLWGCEIVARHTQDGKPLRAVTRDVIADGVLYHMAALDRSNRSTCDPAVERCLDSFHFLQPPRPLVLKRIGALGFRFGYEAMPFVFIGLIAVVAWAAHRLSKRSRARRRH